MKTLVLMAALAGGAMAQQLDLSALDKLDAKASGGANVTLDGQKLQMVSNLMPAEDKDSAEARKLMSGMKGIFVRTFEFKEPGAYAQADLEPIRRQLKAPGWAKIVEARDEGETAEVYFFAGEGGRMGGLAVIAAEPKELAVVNIVGSIDMNMLKSLGGKFGVPKIDPAKPKAVRGKDD